MAFGHAGGGDVVDERGPELVVRHLSDVSDPASEGRHPDGGVRRRPSRDLDPGAHPGVDRGGTGEVDQLHAPLHQAEPGQVVVGGMGQHVDEGVADGHDVERASIHRGVVTLVVGSGHGRGT